MEMMQCQSETDSHDHSELPPPKKRPKVLLPASCREDVTPDSHCGSEYDEKRMDEEIESHFQGSFKHCTCIQHRAQNNSRTKDIFHCLSGHI